jgi:hypothetical protein
MTERRYSKFKLRGSTAGYGLGAIKRFLWERLEKHDSVTEIELAVAALRSDAGDDLGKRSADGGESLRRPVECTSFGTREQ